MIEINLDRLDVELRAIFPTLDIPSPLVVIGSGFNSTVIEAGGTLIFRVGKNSAAQAGFENEISCLPRIAPHLPLVVPDPKWYVNSSPYFPFGAIGYQKIPGLPLHPNEINSINLSLLAGDTAKFLFALQHISPDVLAFQKTVEPASKWEIQPQEVLPFLKDELVPGEFRVVKQWWDDFLDDQKMRQYEPVPQHGDLWYENMLVDAGREKLTGVIDWERLSIGDPAQDFATLFHVGEKFVSLVMHAYQALGGEFDEYFAYRMQRLWEAREFDGLQHAIRFDDLNEVNDALRKLRQGPILQKR